MEWEEYFLKYEEILRGLKEELKKFLKEFEVYVFGSVVRGDYSIGLSDIDVAIVSDEFKNRDKKLEVYDYLFEKFFYSPFEFHLLTKEAWEFYKRFIDKMKKI